MKSSRFKDIRRRGKEKLFQAAGLSEAAKEDEELHVMLHDFQSKERRLKALLGTVGLWSECLNDLQKAGTALLRELNEFSAAESPDRGAKGGSAALWGTQPGEAGLDQMIAGFTKAQRQLEVASADARSEWDAEVTGPLQDLSVTYMSALTKESKKHQQLRLDLSAYQRKVTKARAASGEVNPALAEKLDTANEAFEESTDLLKGELGRMVDCWPLLVRDQIAAALRIQCQLFDGTFVTTHASYGDDESAAGQMSAGRVRSFQRHPRSLHRWIAKGGVKAAELAGYDASPEELKVAAEAEAPEICTFARKSLGNPASVPCMPDEHEDGASAVTATSVSVATLSARAVGEGSGDCDDSRGSGEEATASSHEIELSVEEADAIMVDPEFVDFTIIPLLLRSGIGTWLVSSPHPCMLADTEMPHIARAAYLDAQSFGEQLKNGSNPHAVLQAEVVGSADLLIAALSGGVPSLSISALSSGLTDYHKEKLRSDAFWTRSEEDQSSQRSFTYFADASGSDATGGASSRLAKLRDFSAKQRSASQTDE